MHAREEWLMKAVKALVPLFKQEGYDVPENVRVSVGFPYRAGGKAIGQAWSSQCSKDETFELFISPVLAEPGIVLSTLVHEVVHAVVGLACGHKQPFGRCARAMGLEGKLTATVAGEELAKCLYTISCRLGEYPHAVLQPTDRKKQTTRLLKIACEDCGMPLRVTRQWLDTYELPWTCPCGGDMVEE